MTAAPPREIRPFGLVHWQGFFTLFRREMGRYLKDWVETILASAFSTLLYMLVFALALGPDRSTPEGAQAVAYVLPGLVLFSILTRAGETPVFSIVLDKLEGMISDILTPPIAPHEIAAAYALAGMLSGLMTGVPVIAVAILGLDMPVHNLLGFAYFAILGALILALTGMIVGQWAEKWDHVSAFFGFFFIPLTFLSGLFAPVEKLPLPAQWLVLANPVHYVIDGFRGVTLGVHFVPIWLNAVIVVVTAISLWAVSTYLLARGWRIKS
ncbi:MAG: ABC transporter permease [Pseudomonadota bacterium]